MLRAYVRAQAWWNGLAEERGATAVEYALMLALIAMVIVVAVAFLGESTSERFADFSFDPP
jgi:pilus assembly protein Flp/PilA